MVLVPLKRIHWTMKKPAQTDSFRAGLQEVIRWARPIIAPD